MPKNLTIAAVQMNSTPAPTNQRLERATTLIKDAVKDGADLVVLPELFNTGYSYAEDNYELTETIDGQTVTWMKAQAAEYKIHLCGTLLIKDHNHVYNAALLIAPDGRMWRYDKNYPFLWERAFFREGNNIEIAETDIGTFGMLICWDSAHMHLWQQYAGHVDAMLVPSCPPMFNKMEIVFPGGERRSLHELGPIMELTASEKGYFPLDINDQAAWMGVPVVHTAGGGRFKSTMPAPLLSVGVMTAATPELWDYWQDAPDVQIEADWGQHTKIVNAAGETIGHVDSDGDGYTIAEVELSDDKPRPTDAQSAINTPAMAYFNADVFGYAAVVPIYRRSLRRQWGARMAPIDRSTKVWAVALLIMALLGWLIGRSSKK